MCRLCVAPWVELPRASLAHQCWYFHDKVPNNLCLHVFEKNRATVSGYRCIWMTRVLTISCLHVFVAHMLAVCVHILTLANVEEVQVVTGHYSAAVSSELH